MKRSALFIVGASGVLLALVLPALTAQDKPKQAVEQSVRWEYRVEDLDALSEIQKDNVDATKTLTRKLNELGRDGWEFTHEQKGALSFWLFRRPARN